jgi:hypothetical protein
MLIKQALSEVLQLVACQLFPLHAVVFACFRLLRKTESWHLAGVAEADREPKSEPSFVADKKRRACDGRASKARHPPRRMYSPRRISL